MNDEKKEFLLSSKLFESDEVQDLLDRFNFSAVSVILWILCEIYRDEKRETFIGDEELDEIAGALSMDRKEVETSISAGCLVGLITAEDAGDGWIVKTNHVIDKEADDGETD